MTGRTTAMRTTAPALLVGCLVLLAGCSGFLSAGDSGPAPTYYLLESPSSTAPGSPGPEKDESGPQVVMILEPGLPGALATDGIAIRIGTHRIAYLAGARWSDETPLMLARLLRHAVDTLPGVVAISEDEVGVVPNWRLVSEVDAFYAEAAGEDAAPTRVAVRLTARLIAARPADLFAERRFAAEAAVTGGDPDAIVAAFDAAAEEVAAALVSWLSEQLPRKGRDTGE